MLDGSRARYAADIVDSESIAVRAAARPRRSRGRRSERGRTRRVGDPDWGRQRQSASQRVARSPLRSSGVRGRRTPRVQTLCSKSFCVFGENTIEPCPGGVARRRLRSEALRPLNDSLVRGHGPSSFLTRRADAAVAHVVTWSTARTWSRRRWRSTPRRWPVLVTPGVVDRVLARSGPASPCRPWPGRPSRRRRPSRRSSAARSRRSLPAAAAPAAPLTPSFARFLISAWTPGVRSRMATVPFLMSPPSIMLAAVALVAPTPSATTAQAAMVLTCFIDCSFAVGGVEPVASLLATC